MGLTTVEMQDILRRAYDLMTALPSPVKRNEKYEIESRSKLKGLLEPLREMEEPGAAIAHFVKSAAYFIPRQENQRNIGAMMGFLDLLFADVKAVCGPSEPGEAEIEKIQYLVGYMNWTCDAVCGIMTETENDPASLRKRISSMIEAEFAVVGRGSAAADVTGKVLNWCRNSSEGRRRG